MKAVADQREKLPSRSGPVLSSPAALMPNAFTLIELLVVIAVIAILASLLLPALSKAKAKARTIDCIDHLRQLQLCWHMYTHDNNSELPPNNYVYLAVPGSTNPPTIGERNASWCSSVAPLDTNAISEQTSLLFDYNRSAAIYHCPADTSTVSGRPDLLRNRSYNMSNSIDCTNDNCFRKESEIKVPTQLFVFIDTDADAIYDGSFGVIPIGNIFQDYWLDIPASRHNTHCCDLSFADGHVETWKWKVPKNGRFVFSHNTSSDDLDDLRRLQQCIKGAGGN